MKRQNLIFGMLVGMTAFVAALIFVRIWICQNALGIPTNFAQLKFTRGLTYAFLGWNLLLAWVPYFFARAASAAERQAKSKWMIGTLVLAWLAFLPNAPYIVTDLLHLHSDHPVPLWYDLMLIFSAAWTGLMLGFLSIREMHQLLERKLKNDFVVHSLVISILALTGYGVWLGRFHRWNSWDILTRPTALFEDIFRSLTHTSVMYHTWAISGLLFVFLTIGYYTMAVMMDRK